MIDDSLNPGKRVSIHPGTIILENHGPGGKAEEIQGEGKEPQTRLMGPIKHGTTSGPTGPWA